MLDNNVLFIIGNGFDMDLGLQTSYHSFVESECWPFKYRLIKSNNDSTNDYKCLHDFLHIQTNFNLWYDLEHILGDYACHPPILSEFRTVNQDTFQQANVDQCSFGKLVTSLTKYLKSTQLKDLDQNCVASRVLKKLISEQFYLNIFSFNYTDLNFLASKLGITATLKTTHVHGNLNEGIVLGIESESDFCQPYRYMCKEYNHNYESSTLISHLSQAKYVIIFGHSLSSIDYHYFKNFFSKQSSVDLDSVERKFITIFTYDQESDWDILDQLRQMNNKRLDMLFANNDFRIIHTDGSDEKRVQKFLDDMSIWHANRHMGEFSSFV